MLHPVPAGHPSMDLFLACFFLGTSAGQTAEVIALRYLSDFRRSC